MRKPGELFSMDRVLFLCTGNSCRSQMADGLINHDFAGKIEAISAGTQPQGLDPKAVQVMAEIGIDINGNSSDRISRYENQRFRWIVSLCDHADTNCPAFYNGIARTHIPFVDPPRATGSEDEIIAVYRQVRDQLRGELGEFFRDQLNQKQSE